MAGKRMIQHKALRPGKRRLAFASSASLAAVFFLQLGHDSQAWKNPVYPELLRRGIRWANWVSTRSRGSQGKQ